MQKRIIENNILAAEISRLVNEGEQVSFLTKGMSMLPFIRGNEDSVILKKDDNLLLLDIVLAKVGDTYVIHRIIRIDGDKVTLMGDGNIRGVERCYRSDIVAKAIRIDKGKRQIDCTGKSHRRWAALWRWLLPVRRYLLAIYRRFL